MAKKIDKREKNIENKNKEKHDKIIDSIIGSDIFDEDTTEINELDELFSIAKNSEENNEESSLYQTEEIDSAAELEQLLDSAAESEEFARLKRLSGLTKSAEPKQPKKLEPPKIRKGYASIAVFMVIFTVIGIVNSVFFVQNTINDIRDRKALKEEFALFLYPVVINDPPPYNSVDMLQDSTIISSAIWKIILTGDKSNYVVEAGAMYVPAIDVDKAANSIFGRAPDHKSVYSQDNPFIYDVTTNSYEIPENPSLYAYSPAITSVTNVGELYTVKVDYMAPSPLAIAGIEHENMPIKTMIYIISRTREKTSVNSIQITDFDRGNY